MINGFSAFGLCFEAFRSSFVALDVDDHDFDLHSNRSPSYRLAFNTRCAERVTGMRQKGKLELANPKYAGAFVRGKAINHQLLINSHFSTHSLM
jgi:hypothetical protein